MSQSVEGKKVILKELSKDLVQDYLGSLSQKVCTLLAIKHYDDERWYLNQQLQKVKEGTTFFMCIFQKKSGQLIGAVEIRDASYRSQLYNWLHEDYWGKGYWQDAFKIVSIAYFKTHPQEKNIIARVDVTNIRSYCALKKCGFNDLRISQGPRGKQYELIFYNHTFCHYIAK